MLLRKRTSPFKNFGLTFHKGAFANMGKSWSKLESLSPQAIQAELGSWFVRSRVRSMLLPEPYTINDIDILRDVRSETLVKTNSATVIVRPDAPTMSARSLELEALPRPLKKQCLHTRDEYSMYHPFNLVSGECMELHELQSVQSNSGELEKEKAISMRDWVKRFPHMNITMFEHLKLHLAFYRFMQVTQQIGHIVPASLIEPDIYPSHFARRYFLKRESSSIQWARAKHRSGNLLNHDPMESWSRFVARVCLVGMEPRWQLHLVLRTRERLSVELRVKMQSKRRWKELFIILHLWRLICPITVLMKHIGVISKEPRGSLYEVVA